MKRVNLVLNEFSILDIRSTLDRFTFVDVKVRAASYEILGKFSKASTKLGYMC